MIILTILKQKPLTSISQKSNTNHTIKYNLMRQRKKVRLDVYLVNQKLVETREKAIHLIKKGKVMVNQIVTTKPGKRVTPKDKIFLLEKIMYVGRGGEKLDQALKELLIEIKGRVCLDVGTSIGGFTDCLLQRGAKRVYAVETGRGLLHPKLHHHPKIRLLENTDIRKLKILPEKVDLITVDISRHSLRQILPHLPKFLKPKGGRILALFKPQYEAGKNKRKKAIEYFQNWLEENNWQILGKVQAKPKGKKGTQEFFFCLSPPDKIP